MLAYARISCQHSTFNKMLCTCLICQQAEKQFERGAWVMLYSSNQKALESLPARTQKPYTVVYPSAAFKY